VLTGLDDAQIARLLMAGELCEIAEGTTLATACRSASRRGDGRARRDDGPQDVPLLAVARHHVPIVAGTSVGRWPAPAQPATIWVPPAAPTRVPATAR